MPQLLWCYSSVHLGHSRSSPGYYQGSAWKRPHPQGKNSTFSWGHSSFIRILPQKHQLFFPRPVLWIGLVWGYGFPSRTHCSQPIYGVLWAKSSEHCPHPQVLVQVCGWHFCHPKGSKHTVLTKPYYLQWKTTKRMVPSPFGIPL